MNQTVTRTAFCPHCYKNHSPKSGDLVLLHGSSSGDHIDTIKSNDVRWGYTPHLFIYTFENDEYVFYEKACCLSGCDIVIFHAGTKQGQPLFNYKILNTKMEKMRKQDWEALLNFTDPQYYGT